MLVTEQKEIRLKSITMFKCFMHASLSLEEHNGYDDRTVVLGLHLQLFR